MTGSIGVTLRKAVTDGLGEYLGALPAFNGDDASEHEVEVSYAHNPASSATEQVYTGRSRADTPPAAMRSGRNYRDETGEFDLIVRAKYMGGNAYDSDLRASEIGEACEDWMAERKSNQIGVTGLNTLTVVGWDSNYGGADSSAESLLIYRVRWTARLT